MSKHTLINRPRRAGTPVIRRGVTRRRVLVAGTSAAALVALAWPGPATADSSLGGYSALATASVVHLEVFEPVIPIPATPEGDFSIGYTASNVDSGPSSRALASYLWPGSVIGDGFDQLTGDPGSMYPVQVNSRYPATANSPAKNTAQLTDGNGMTTSTDGLTTNADVTGLGITNGGTNLLSGLGTGLASLLPSTSTSSSSTTKGAGTEASGASTPAPTSLPVPTGLADLVTAKNLTSHSTTVVTDSKVTSTATAAASDISILGGLLGLTGIEVTSTVTSNGTTSTSTGSATIGGITIAGTPLSLGNAGVSVGSSSFKLPAIPAALTSLLSEFGVSFSVAPVTKSTSGATSSFSAQALSITIDTGPLKEALNGPLASLLNLFGSNAATQLAPLIQLKPKVVILLGDLSTTATASPAYSGGGGSGTIPGGGGGGTTGTGGGEIQPGGTAPGVISDGSTPPSGVIQPAGDNNPGGSTISPTAESLPPLADVPRFLILGALILALAIGWVMQAAGGLLLGGGGTCRLGLSTGVPDLRKG